jgi:hypothetical protein
MQLISPRQAYGIEGNAEEDEEQQSVSADWLTRVAEPHGSSDDKMVRCELPVCRDFTSS